VIRCTPGQGHAGFDHIETVHASFRSCQRASGGEGTGMTKMTTLAVEKIGIEREDDLRLVEQNKGTGIDPAGDAGGGEARLIAD